MGANTGGLGPEMRLAVVSGAAPAQSSVPGPAPSGKLADCFGLVGQRASEVPRAMDQEIDPLHDARNLLETFWKETFVARTLFLVILSLSASQGNIGTLQTYRCKPC